MSTNFAFNFTDEDLSISQIVWFQKIQESVANLFHYLMTSPDYTYFIFSTTLFTYSSRRYVMLANTPSGNKVTVFEDKCLQEGIGIVKYRVTR